MTDALSEQCLVALILLGGATLLSHARQLPDGLSAGRDREWLLVAAAVILALVVLPLGDLEFGWLKFADLPFSDEFAWIGLFKGALAVWLLWRAIVDYQRPDELAAGPDRTGIYGYIRHPLYTALLVFALAQLALAQNWLAGLLTLVAFCLAYGLRVPRDEQQGLERFGHDYLEYMARTGALLPRLPRSQKRR